MKPEKMVDELQTALGVEPPKWIGDLEGRWMYLLGVAMAATHPLKLNTGGERD